MSVTLISVSHDTVVSNKHEEQTRHYYVNFQHTGRTIVLSSSLTWGRSGGGGGGSGGMMTCVIVIVVLVAWVVPSCCHHRCGGAVVVAVVTWR